MSTFIEVIYSRYIRRYEKTFLVLFLILLFAIVGFIVYRTYYLNKKKTNKFDNVPNKNSRTNVVEVYFFHVDWCPHCKTAKPVWYQFKDQYNNSPVNGYTIKCIDMDCSNDSDPKVKDTLTRFNIDSYPTVKMNINDKTVDFDAKITTNSLTQFVNQMTA